MSNKDSETAAKRAKGEEKDEGKDRAGEWRA